MTRLEEQLDTLQGWRNNIIPEKAYSKKTLDRAGPGRGRWTRKEEKEDMGHGWRAKITKLDNAGKARGY